MITRKWSVNLKCLKVIWEEAIKMVESSTIMTGRISMRKPGFITSNAPRKASIKKGICCRLNFSLRKIPASKNIKKGPNCLIAITSVKDMTVKA